MGNVAPEENGDKDDQPFTGVGGTVHTMNLVSVEDTTAFLYRCLDGGEAVVSEHPVGRFGATRAHRHADIRLLQRRGVVDAVTRSSPRHDRVPARPRQV